MEDFFSVFRDDGVIYTKKLPNETKVQHLTRCCKYIHRIFDILEAHDLYVKPEKCMFEQEEIEYLGVIIGRGRLHMDPKKLQGIVDYPIPRNPTDVRTFLGFTGYYCYFVQGSVAAAL